MITSTQQIRLAALSPAAPGTVTGLVATGDMTDEHSQHLGGYRSMRVEASLQGATGGTLDVFLEISVDHGVTWTEYIHWTQFAAAGAAKRFSSAHSRSQSQTTIADTSVALAANTARDGEWGHVFRLKYIAGAGTSAGAAQIVKITLSP